MAQRKFSGRRRTSRQPPRVLIPQSFKPPRRGSRVTRRVLDVLVAEVVLDQTQIRHLAQVGEMIPATVPKHVRPHMAELRALSSLSNDVRNALAGELCPALRDEQPGQAARADREIVDRPQLVAGNRLGAVCVKSGRGLAVETGRLVVGDSKLTPGVSFGTAHGLRCRQHRP
jgi:hypothetical protein